MKKLRDILAQRIMLLDGAMGTMIQRYNLSEEDFRGREFASWGVELKGCNDILSLTKGEVLEQIHREYLTAGADIITTCTFNAHPISLSDYSLSDYSYPISREAARIAREVADQFNALNPHKPRFVAGSMGPTNRTASISADVSNPASREVRFEELMEGYLTQLRGLIDGGCDIILLETIFDSLNAKAALYAVELLGEERGCTIPVMASGTLADASGRSLAGQDVESIYTSLAHADLLSIGLNCAFGARDLMPYIERLAAVAQCAISAHPNAGLPNVLGGYDETPEMFSADVEEYLRRGLINIVGGCCGTTPQHILCLQGIVERYSPREIASEPIRESVLCGLERLHISRERNFINIGERCNVAGSAKFARLIREGEYEEALSIARAQVDSGAQIIDICMDDALIDAQEAMSHMLSLIVSEPEIARVPIMVDSSKWEVLHEGLKLLQGKSVVNSISLKEGEEELLSRAREIHRLGAAAVVMLFDERGQADSFERKVEIAQRAYNLLTNSGFPPEDIIFDANILAVATGIEQHDSYAKAFIDATRWIKSNLPYAKVSGGVSNLSFAFRGNNAIREAMHSVFLYHAIEAGLDMAIVNAQMLQIYDEIEPELRERIEDVILFRREDAAERLIEFAQSYKAESKKQSNTEVNLWREESLAKRIEYAMLKGVTEYIEVDAMEGYNTLHSPTKVIDELLMPAMERVGELFGEGRMFLPQVVKSARVMKCAVGVLTPYIEALKGSSEAKSSGRVLIATVKGDVHDIGKNIVAVVMSCNGYEVDDLGVMVETRKIVDEASGRGVDAICLSGLITPSLEEMIRVVEESQRAGLDLPIIIGGATTSPLHTAVKIAPHYAGVVIHARNASDNPKILSQLLNSETREEYIASIKSEQEELRKQYARTLEQRNLLPLEEARARAQVKSTPCAALQTGRLVFPDFDIEDVEELIDWNFFFTSWGLKGRYPAILTDEKYGEQATKLLEDVEALLESIKADRSLTLQGVVALLPARSEGDDIVVTDKKGVEHRLAMLRSQSSGDSRSVADYIAPKGDHVGAFALTAGVGLEKRTAKYKEAGDDYSAMLAKLLSDRLTEAFCERVHSFVRRQMWGFEQGVELTAKEIIRGEYRGVRLAFGYPATPDHSLKREVFKLLAVEMTTQMSLAESYMITPAESLCGLILSDGEYFSVGRISEEQVSDYARRRDLTTEQIESLIPHNV